MFCERLGGVPPVVCVACDACTKLLNGGSALGGCRAAEGAAAGALLLRAVAGVHAVGAVLPGEAGRERLVRHAGDGCYRARVAA